MLPWDDGESVNSVRWIWMALLPRDIDRTRIKAVQVANGRFEGHVRTQAQHPVESIVLCFLSLRDEVKAGLELGKYVVAVVSWRPVTLSECGPRCLGLVVECQVVRGHRSQRSAEVSQLAALEVQDVKILRLGTQHFCDVLSNGLVNFRHPEAPC